MKKLNLLPLAVLLSSGMFLTSCEKESDSIAPVEAVAQSADSQTLDPNIPVLVVGNTYQQYTPATGLNYWVASVCTRFIVTGQGYNATFEGSAAPQASETTFVNTFNYPGVNGKWLYFDVRTVIKTDGTFVIREKINLKQQPQ